MSDRPLTAAELRVLRAAARGDLYRSESIGALYDSFVRGERRKVNGIVDRLIQRDPQLLTIGDPVGVSRPWHLTTDGEESVAKHEKRVDREARP